ncbi:relaxin-3 [Ochotona princeps]|uniref:relaxin-3 n=1 Tax=Ochotona princeps TaxID=9978 RepID=UPI0027151CEA|nr:relaxin-3 [Ochotona princeps]
MARLSLLLLLLLLLAGERWPGTQARAAPYGVKLCGREFIRAVIFTCGGSRWRRSESLGTGHEAGGEAFAEVVADADSLVAGELEDTVSSSEWLALTKPPQAFYSSGSRPAWQGAIRGGRDVLSGLSSNCCKWGCTKSEISVLC